MTGDQMTIVFLSWHKVQITRDDVQAPRPADLKEVLTNYRRRGSTPDLEHNLVVRRKVVLALLQCLTHVREDCEDSLLDPSLPVGL